MCSVNRTWWGQLIFAPCRESSEGWLTCLVVGAGCGLGSQLELSAGTPTRGCPCACLLLCSEVAEFQELSREKKWKLPVLNTLGPEASTLLLLLYSIGKEVSEPRFKERVARTPPLDECQRPLGSYFRIATGYKLGRNDPSSGKEE